MQVVCRNVRNVLLLLALTTAPAFSAEPAVSSAAEAIEARQHLMRNIVAAAKVVRSMIRGETPFDAVKADFALRTIDSAAYGYGFYFPEGSGMGGETEALPAIWRGDGAFEAALKRFQTDVTRAVAAKAADLPALAAVFEPVNVNCKTCHSAFKRE